MGAIGDRLQHIVVRQRSCVAMSLDLELVRRHRQRNIDRQHQLDIDRFIRARSRRQAEHQRQRGTVGKEMSCARESRHSARVSEDSPVKKTKARPKARLLRSGQVLPAISCAA